MEVGDGTSILLWVDPIVGMEDSSIFSSNLVEYLNDFGMTTLSHVRNAGVCYNYVPYWLEVEDLDLGGPWKDEWYQYTVNLNRDGIILRFSKDNIVWALNGTYGKFTTKDAYNYIAHSHLV